MLEREGIVEKEEMLIKTRNLLFDYFYNNKFLLFLLFLGFYNLLQVLKLLENFYWLDLLTLVIPIIIMYSLANFYCEMREAVYSKKTLNITISAINIYLFISTIIVVFIILMLLPLIFQASFLLVIMTLSVAVIVVNLQAVYYTSLSLSVIKYIFDTGKINYRKQYYFSKASSRYILSGIINIIVFIFTLFNEDAKEVNKLGNIKYQQLINLGDFSQFIEVLVMVIGLIYPFIIAKVLENTSLGLEKIYNDIYKKNEELD